MTNFSDVSVLIPYRSDGGHRDDLCEWVKARYEAMFDDIEIVIGSPRDDTPYFSRAVALNEAAAKATRDVFVVADGDVIAYPDSIRKAVDSLDSTPWVLPYKYYVTVSEADTVWLLHQDAATDPKLGCTFTPQDYYWPSRSGLAVISKENYWAVGGFDERFVGWAPEDAAWANAVSTMCGPPSRIHSRNLYHMWHPIAPDSDGNHLIAPTHDGTLKHRKANDALFARYEAAYGDRDHMTRVLDVGGR